MTPFSVSAKVSWCARARSKLAGNSWRIWTAKSVTISSGVWIALPPVVRGYISNTVSIKYPTVFISKAMFAFVCKPKTSGSSSKGSWFT